MKKVGLVTWMVILAAVVSAFSVLTIEADDVRGTYWNSEKTAHIRIYRAKDGLYYGKIDKLVEPNNARSNIPILCIGGSFNKSSIKCSKP